MTTASERTAPSATPTRPERPLHPLPAGRGPGYHTGLLFGYDQVVISGALSGIDKTFHPGTVVIEIITSWVPFGAMVGAGGRMLTDRYGRGMTIILAAVIFVLGALLEALAPDTVVLVVGRLVLGGGVGIASVGAPLYGAENAPARVRGRFVLLYQMAITIGTFLVYFADYLLTNQGSNAWRVMLGVSAIPALLLVVAMWPLRDSARWSVKVGRRSDAEAVMRKVVRALKWVERVSGSRRIVNPKTMAGRTTPLPGLRQMPKFTYQSPLILTQGTGEKLMVGCGWAYRRHRGGVGACKGTGTRWHPGVRITVALT